jgi:hypothetical protein
MNNKTRKARRLRAVAISVAAHGVVLAVLVLARFGAEPVRPSPLIFAELITRAPQIPAPAGTTPNEAVAPVTPPEAVTPHVRELRSEPAEPAPSPIAAPEPSVSEPEVEVPAEDVPEPVEGAPSGEPVLADESDVVNDSGLADTNFAEPVPAPTATEPPTPTRADEALRRRLASWTGEITPRKPEPTVTWRDAGQQYTAVLRRQPAADAMGMDRLVVAVATERDGKSLATELTMTRLAFSNFAQFIDRWDDGLYLHDDVIDGRFHSNTGLTVLRERGMEPTFTGKVTIVGNDVTSGDPDGIYGGAARPLNRRKMFPAGLETNTRRIWLPQPGATLDSDALPEGRVQRFKDDADVVFNWDGSFAWRPHDGRAAPERRELGEEPFYLVAAKDATLHVSGVVNGKVLVYSPESIVIVGNLTYADDPSMPGASDYLGLVAERTVEVAEPRVTGVGDLTIHASIYARNRFTVREFRSRRSGVLAIIGSVTAGSLSATEPRYATAIAFDDRLASMRAPGFPLSDRYELDEWNGEWWPVEQ